MDELQQPQKLSPLGQVFSGLFRHVCDLYERGDYEESFVMARRLLTYAKLGDYHRAGLHLLLGGSSQHGVWHAERSLYLYQNLYTVRPGGTFDGSQEVSQSNLDDQKHLIARAQEMLDKARKAKDKVDAKFTRDMKRYRDYYGHDPTDEQLIEADMEPHSEAVDAYFAKLDELLDDQHTMPQVDVDDDDDEDEDDENAPWPFIPLPTPPDSQSKDLPAGSSQGSGGAHQPAASQGSG